MCRLERELTRAVVPRSLDRVFGSGVQGVSAESAKRATMGVQTCAGCEAAVKNEANQGPTN